MNTTQSYNPSTLSEPLINSNYNQLPEKTQPKTEDPKTQHKENKNINLEEQVPVKWKDFARFATSWDLFLMAIGTIVSFLNGWGLPFFSLIFGGMTGDIITYWDDLNYVGRKYAFYFIGLGGICWVCSYISLASWMITGEKQAIRFRIAYFKALLRQDISWYDKSNPNEISTKVTNDCFSIQAAVGEKVATLSYTMGNVLGGLTIAIIKGWKLALILAAVIIIPMAIAGAVFVLSLQKLTTANTKAYETAGGYAEQAITEIRTVRSLNGEELEHRNYVKYLDLVKGIIFKYGTIAGIAFAMIFFILYSSFALGLWYGAKLVGDLTSGYDAGKVVTIFFSLINGMFGFGQITPCLKAFAVGKDALGRVYALLTRQPAIDIEDEKGLRPESYDGRISFNKVVFTYPIRPQETVLNEFSALFEANKKTAIVGESGCGKSTCMQLIERFYDVQTGSIKLDNYDVKDLNLRWLRENIGYVGQEPVLFATTIKNNLLFGKENATMEELIEATKKARAYEFIAKLENGFDTYVGSGGAQMSGGQKQRLAIARVILKNPKILLLDEATSALDRKNEREIQETLDYISEGKTTIIIAHRISTIQNADKIIFVDKGRVIDEGTHNELIERNEKYRKIAEHQLAKKNENTEGEEEEEKDNEDEKLVKRPNDLDYSSPNNDDNTETIDLEIPKPNKKSFGKTGKKVNDIKSWAKDGGTETKQAQGENEKDKENSKEGLLSVFWRLFKYNQSQNFTLAFLLLSAAVTGAIIPVFAVLFAQMIDILGNPQAPDFHSRANFISLMFLVIAFAMLISFGFQSGLGNVIGENATKRLRIDLYKKILSMDMSWFDREENTPGTLMARLSADTILVNSLVSSVAGIIVQSISSLLTGVIISFCSSWQVTLICIATTPLSLVAGYFQQLFQSGYSANTDSAYKDCGGFLTEMIVNMRTVASFGREKSLNETYTNLLQKPLRMSRSRGNKAGFIFGLSQFLIYGVFAISFYFGIFFLNKGNISFLQMYTAIFALFFAAYGSGAATQYMTDVGAAKNAGKAIFATFEEDVKIEDHHGKQSKSQDQLKGLIEFKNVTFKYPSREQIILHNLDLRIEPGQKVALVGPSGCGKSTIFQLLLRFYDVQSGQILIDGRNIKDYDIRYLRQQLGLVLQEPVLFRGTIEENIRYNSQGITMEQIKGAAENANALAFIERNQFECNDLDNGDYGSGFQRKVGPKGSQLSGGQKQRIAIARAIIRNPAIYLFDEPTSALDSQNEESIQESLERLMERSTSITIAHRMSTVKNCEKIFVFLEGRIVESGDYRSLVEKQGVFYKLEKGLPLNEK